MNRAIEHLKPWVKSAPDRFNRLINRIQSARYRRRVEEVLKSPNPPLTAPAEAACSQLLRTPPAIPEYDYGLHAVWERGLRRARHLIELTDRRPQLRILEIGCGDGMTGWMLHAYGHEVWLTDQEDWRDPRCRSLPFVIGELEGGLPVEPNHFDLVFSYNTFEHLRDPHSCYAELLRLCRPDGIVHLDFGPLFASAWGLHAYRTLPIPYAQFLFSEPFLIEKFNERGISDLGKPRDTLQPLNRWRLDQFNRLFNDGTRQVRQRQTLTLCRFLPWILRFPTSFHGRGLGLPDVITTHVIVTLGGWTSLRP